MRRRAWILGSALTCVVTTLHCSKSALPTGGGTPPVPPIAADTSQVCNTIGPEGGSITHPAHAQLVVPAGALDQATRICLTGVAAPSTDALGASALGQAFDATPAGQTFRKPVDVYLPFDAARLTPGAIVDDVEIRMAPQETHDFVSLSSAAHLDTGRVHAQTVHFTEFVPALNPNPVFITTPTALPPGTVGEAYTQALAASGGTAPYTWSLSPLSALPPGLIVVSSGSLAGTPTLPSTYGFFLSTSDSAGHSVQAAFSMLVGQSNNAVPTLTRVTPSTVPQGSPTTTIALAGSGFAPTGQVFFDSVALPTTFQSATALTAAVPSASLVNAGTHQVTVWNPAPGGGTSGAVPFVVTAVAQNPVPTITSVTPTQLPVTTVDNQITITGSNFVASTSAAIGAQGIPTRYDSATQLTATIPAANLATPGILHIDVYTPPPGGGFSATSIDVSVGNLNPVPTLSSLSPTRVAEGSGAFTLTATGTGFVTGGQLFFGSTALATTVANATTASASVPASLVLHALSTNITLVNPSPGGGASGSLAFVVGSTADAGADGGALDGGGAADGGPSDAGIVTTKLVPNCARAFGSSGRDEYTSVAVDGDDNTIVSGTGGPAAWPGGTTLTGHVVAKFDAQCNYLWGRSFGDLLFSDVGRMAVDGANNIFFAALSAVGAAVDFGNGAVSGNVILAKLDPAGSAVWSKGFSTSGGTATAIAVDRTGSLLVTGYFTGTLNFGGPDLTTAPSAYAAFIVKFDGTGRHLWSRSLGGTTAGPVAARTVAVDASGDVILAGGMNGTVDLGGGPQTNTGTGGGGFIVKLRGATGEHVWSRVVSSTTQVDMIQASAQANGDAVVFGELYGTVDLGDGPRTAKAGNDGTLLARLDSATGATVFSRAYDASGGTVRAMGNRTLLGVAAHNGSGVDFGVGVVAGWLGLALIDGAGTPVWTGGYGSALTIPRWAAPRANGGVVVGGDFSGTLTFGSTTLVNASDAASYTPDMFFVRFDP